MPAKQDTPPQTPLTSSLQGSQGTQPKMKAKMKAKMKPKMKAKAMPKQRAPTTSQASQTRAPQTRVRSPTPSPSTPSQRTSWERRGPSPRQAGVQGTTGDRATELGAQPYTSTTINTLGDKGLKKNGDHHKSHMGSGAP